VYDGVADGDGVGSLGESVGVNDGEVVVGIFDGNVVGENVGFILGARDVGFAVGLIIGKVIE